MLLPVIMCGGTGSRLWPLSRETYPKQFINVIGEVALLQQALRHTHAIENMLPPLIICNQEHRFMVAEVLRKSNIQNADIILEHTGKNTAPAVATAAIFAKEKYDNPNLLIMPADHHIKNEKVFIDKVLAAESFADKGHLITFGVKPTRPETGFGYIKSGNKLSDDDIFTIDSFVEKPDRETAKTFIAEPTYFWNSGIFMFSTNSILEEYLTYAHDILEHAQSALTSASRDLDYIRLNKNIFSRCPEGSVDTLIMEQTKKGVMVTMDADWSDLGSWDAIWETTDKDENDNAIKGDVYTTDTTKSYLHAQHRFLAVVGMDDCIVVELPDAVLVCKRGQSQEIKKVVAHLKSQKRLESHSHRKVYRPWGSYDSIDEDSRFKVKRIIVNPGASLSLQKHFHRSEHWVVVKGTAQVEKDDEKMMLHENQSTYIPAGAKHRLTNPGKIPLELIEVQSGSYLGEDDIVRFEDAYGRTKTTEEIV